MTKPMTHLEAFMSEDGRRGREWREYNHTYRRNDRCLERRPDSSSDWKDVLFQVAAMENSECTWVDEPKTLTPGAHAVAAHLGRNGVVRITGHDYRLRDAGVEVLRGTGWYKYDGVLADDLLRAEIVPDPSQPAEPVTYAEALSNAMDMPSYVKAEPQRDWNPFGPYEDTPADIQRDIETERGHAKAESRVEYPKSSCSCMGDASCPCRRNK